MKPSSFYLSRILMLLLLFSMSILFLASSSSSSSPKSLQRKMTQSMCINKFTVEALPCFVTPRRHSAKTRITITTPRQNFSSLQQSLSSSSISIGNNKNGKIINQKQTKEKHEKQHRKRTATPRHIAFICDGNRRWAKSHTLPSSAGHAKGADQTISLLQNIASQPNIDFCTLYAFSTENWSRPQTEIQALLRLMEDSAKSLRSKAVSEKMKVRVLGDLEDERIPNSLRVALLDLVEDTSKVKEERLTICLAVNYGGRKDIMNAALSLAKDILEEEKSVEGNNDNITINEDTFGERLCTSGIPDPDLIVRTAGECRLSNFLLWNAAYAELYFTDVLWPDFDGDCLEEALDWYECRSRRYGV